MFITESNCYSIQAHFSDFQNNRHLLQKREQGEIIDVSIGMIDFIFYYWRCLMYRYRKTKLGYY
ncbi:hypothetical protein D5R40_12520 [Okeania hirsuta]|uniref:Uncharacterized protein n=1 Tax=Okeania hirsuta TaxID=1458930 RepID=A0A3N6PAP1_9CYAN|nr:hypothetical protein D4Z78_10260 [Okeania hirsuta]RQH43742.1 hypothetical protein D5R40_12520 [Okeania hirsuta]